MQVLWIFMTMSHTVWLESEWINWVMTCWCKSDVELRVQARVWDSVKGAPLRYFVIWLVRSGVLFTTRLLSLISKNITTEYMTKKWCEVMKSLVYNNVVSSYSLTLLPYSLDIDLGNGVQVRHGHTRSVRRNFFLLSQLKIFNSRTYITRIPEP